VCLPCLCPQPTTPAPLAGCHTHTHTCPSRGVPLRRCTPGPGTDTTHHPPGAPHATWAPYTRVVLTRCWLPAAAAATAVSIGLAAAATVISDQQPQFVADVVQHGGVNADHMINGETPNTLGDAVCSDLHHGNAAANEVIGVSNDMHIPMSQAEVVVYWAITDLCTDQMSQRQDHWRDGKPTSRAARYMRRSLR
jgi:hypothetical protein